MKRLIAMISTEGKSKEQIATQAIEAIEKFKKAAENHKKRADTRCG